MTGAALAALLGILLLHSPAGAFAAGSGSVTVKLPAVQNESFDSSTSFTFRLYKIASFEGTSLEADELLKASGAEIVLPESEISGDIYSDANRDYWLSRSMESASTLADWIAVHPETAKSLEAGSSHTLKQEESFTESGLSDGLYLLTGSTVLTKKGAYTRWQPVPMYILVRDGSAASADAKIGSEPAPEKHRVTKLWAGDTDVQQELRPDGIQVAIYYGSTLWKTVKLDASCSWSYEWESRDVQEKWRCVELFDAENTSGLSDTDKANYEKLKKNYSFTVTKLVDGGEDQSVNDELGKVEMFRITNTFSRSSLRIVKTSDSYVDHSGSDAGNNTVVFELSGFDSKGEQVYHNYVSAVFKRTDGTTKELDVSNIPADVAKLRVREAYTGSLKPADGEEAVKEAAYDAASKTYSVSFSNTYGGTSYSGGIVNNYELRSGGSGYKFIGSES